MTEYGNKIEKLGEGTICAYELFDRGIEHKRTTFRLWLRDCLPETRIDLAEVIAFALTNYEGLDFYSKELYKAKGFIISYNSSTFGMKAGTYINILEIRFTQKRNHKRIEETVKDVFESFIEELSAVEEASPAKELSAGEEASPAKEPAVDAASE